MKRKQKTPRRIRPSESSDVDSGSTPCTPTSSEMQGTKKKKMEAETQTENVDTLKSQVPNMVANTSRLRSEARFSNEHGSSNMPLILNVFSLSEAAPPRASKQLEVVSKQDNSFPVTPPCSPPLIQLGAFKSIPVARPGPQVPKRGNAIPCGYVPRDNTQMFNRNSKPADPRVHCLYDTVEQMTNTSSHLIANGVLPFAAQNTCGQQAYADTNNNPFNGYLNSPISQLTNMFNLGNKYLVSKESFVTKGSNSMFTRFKLQHNANNASENRPPNECVELPREFQQPLTKNTRQCIDPENNNPYGSSKRFSYALQKAAATNGQPSRSDIGVGREACHSSNGVIPMDNQNQCSQGYLGFQQGYGHNNALRTQTPAVTAAGGANAPRVSFISNPPPYGPTKAQSWETDRVPQIVTSSEDESSGHLSPRDVKVQRLKRQLEEQLAKLKSLNSLGE